MKELFESEEGLNELLVSNYFNKNQSTIPENFELIEKYPLNPPFSYANILYDPDTSGYQYKVDEIQLNHAEQDVYQQLYNLVEQNLETKEGNVKNTNFAKFLNGILKENQSLFHSHSRETIEKVRYYLTRDVEGFGIIDSLMHDPNIEDISCSGIDTPIYVWHRRYDSLPTNIKFESDNLNTFVSRIVFRAGKHVSSAHPISDLALEGNHRISVLYQKEVTPKGTSFTIRKFREDPYTIVDLLNFGTVDADIAAYLWMLVESKMSIMILGSTGSGKTTLLNSISGMVNPDYKIFSVEDVAEININHENWFSLVSRTGFGTQGEGEIGLFDLIKSGVRHRPDYIIVGEIRGAEAYVMFQAIATGHGGLCTMHADSLDAASKRLQQQPMNIPPSYLSLMNCVIVIRRIRDPDTGLGKRKIISIEEISQNNTSETIFKWSPRNDSFESNLEESNLLKKIADSTGQLVEEVQEEWHRRKLVINWLTEQGIHDYRSVSNMIRKYYRDPQAVINKIEYGV